MNIFLEFVISIFLLFLLIIIFYTLILAAKAFIFDGLYNNDKWSIFAGISLILFYFILFVYLFFYYEYF